MSNQSISLESFIDAVRSQRDAANDEAARLAALCNQLSTVNAALEANARMLTAKIAELEESANGGHSDASPQ